MVRAGVMLCQQPRERGLGVVDGYADRVVDAFALRVPAARAGADLASWHPAGRSLRLGVDSGQLGLGGGQLVGQAVVRFAALGVVTPATA